MRIEIRNVTVDFENPRLRALRDVDLTIDVGERVALLGASGSGKTTLLRLMLGAVRPSAGTARIGDFDPFGRGGDVDRLRRLTGCVRQRDDLVAGLTGRTNALMATTHEWRIGDWLSLLRGRAPRRYSAELDSLARHHGIDASLSARVEKLSGGQRQRVALVRALLARPHLLLADEPTSGLDPHNAKLVVDGMLGASTRTVVIATHDLEVASQVTRVVALREGRIVYDGVPPDDDALGQIYGPSEEPVCA